MALFLESSLLLRDLIPALALAATLLVAVMPLARAEEAALSGPSIPEVSGFDPQPTVTIAVTGFDQAVRKAFWTAADACRRIPGCAPISARYQTRPGEPLDFTAETDVGAAAFLARTVREGTPGIKLEVEGFSTDPFAPEACATLAAAVDSVRMAAFPGERYAKSPCSRSDKPLKDMRIKIHLSTRLPSPEASERLQDPAFLILCLYAALVSIAFVPVWWYGMKRPD